MPEIRAKRMPGHIPLQPELLPVLRELDAEARRIKAERLGKKEDHRFHFPVCAFILCPFKCLTQG